MVRHSVNTIHHYFSYSDLGGSELESEDESNYGIGQQFAIRGEMHSAIQRGDWSLVGATAAIIAQSPEDYPPLDVNSSSSALSCSIDSGPRRAERAAELDKLIEAGDWEAVVFAAAKFETENDRDAGTDCFASISEGQEFLANRNHAQQSDANSK